MATKQPTRASLLRKIERLEAQLEAVKRAERSSTPGGIPDPAGAWVRYDDHAAALARAAHAAAPKAAPARWYMINAVGMATLCADKQDAEQAAADAQAAWPHAGPHRAVQMLEVAVFFNRITART